MTARADKDEAEIRELGYSFTSIIYCQYIYVHKVQFNEGTYALNMQFDKGTLRLFMQSDEGKLSFMSRKTELLPAHLSAHLRKFPRAFGHASASRSPHGEREFSKS